MKTSPMSPPCDCTSGRFSTWNGVSLIVPSCTPTRFYKTIAGLAKDNGSGSIPWTDVNSSPANFCDMSQFPSTFDTFQELGHWSRGDCMAWLDQLRANQNANGGCAFRFSHVLINGKRTPAVPMAERTWEPPAAPSARQAASDITPTPGAAVAATSRMDEAQMVTASNDLMMPASPPARPADTQAIGDIESDALSRLHLPRRKGGSKHQRRGKQVATRNPQTTLSSDDSRSDDSTLARHIDRQASEDSAAELVRIPRRSPVPGRELWPGRAPNDVTLAPATMVEYLRQLCDDRVYRAAVYFVFKIPVRCRVLIYYPVSE